MYVCVCMCLHVCLCIYVCFMYAHNLRNIKCLLWAGACDIIYNFIFLNYFYTGTISVKE